VEPGSIDPQDPLAHPIRARLFDALVGLRRRATTAELASVVERHPNSVRVQLQQLADAGLVHAHTTPRPRGRPRVEWAIAPEASPGGRPPEAHDQLSRWLARAMQPGVTLDDVEATGQAIGRELAPAAHGRHVRDSMCEALSALGFQPRPEAEGQTLRFVLGNCPYRDAVRENQPLICSLHRGITRGLLERLDAQARLENFVARDPYDAGCLIEVAPV
jgi:predicted ArsR family transcriptional regulator